MSEYDNPRPTAGTPYSDPCAVKDMATTLGKVVDGNSTVTTYNGNQILSLSQAVDKFGFGEAVFTFATGGTLESKKLLVSNEPVDGFLYKYVGAGSAPIVVTAGTDPTVVGDWQVFAATSLQALSGLTEPSDLAQRHRIKTTVAEIATGVFKVGDMLEVTDRDNGRFKVEAGIPDGFGKINAGHGNIAQIQHSISNTIDMYGAATGVNSSDAINSALATHYGRIGASSSGYILDKQLDVVEGPCTGLTGQGVIDCVMIKAFNGDAVIIRNQGAALKSFWIQGESATHTGGGVYVIADNVNLDLRVTDTDDSCVICKANASVFLGVEGHYTPKSGVSAIRGDGVDSPASPTVRNFSKISGALSIDVSGMNQVIINDTLFSQVITSADTGKLVMKGCRITSQQNINLLGNDHIIVGNNWTHGSGTDTTISGNNITWGKNNYVSGSNTKASPIIAAPYGGPLSNDIDTNLVDFSSAVQWKGTSVNGSFGNALKSAYFKMTGRKCYLTFALLTGSTTVNPVGFWSVTVPFKALVSSRFPVLIKSSDGTFYSAVGQLQGGGNEIFFYLNGVAGAVGDASLTFAANSQIEISGSYLVAPT